jgi:hypothetical protein
MGISNNSSDETETAGYEDSRVEWPATLLSLKTGELLTHFLIRWRK